MYATILATLSVVVFMLICAVSWFAKQYLLLQVEQDKTQHKISVVNKELRAISAASSNLSNCLGSIDERVDELKKRQDDLEVKSPHSEHYSQAQKLVEMGACEEDLVASCDMTRAEAELVIKMQKKIVKHVASDFSHTALVSHSDNVKQFKAKSTD